jgi:hypothetical protein
MKKLIETRSECITENYTDQEQRSQKRKVMTDEHESIIRACKYNTKKIGLGKP